MFSIRIPAFTITVARREPTIPPTIPPDTPPELAHDKRGRSIAHRTAKLRELIPERTIRRVIDDCREDPDFAAFGAIDWELVYELFGLAQAGDDIPDDEDDSDDSNSNDSSGAH